MDPSDRDIVKLTGYTKVMTTPPPSHPSTGGAPQPAPGQTSGFPVNTRPQPGFPPTGAPPAATSYPAPSGPGPAAPGPAGPGPAGNRFGGTGPGPGDVDQGRGSRNSRGGTGGSPARPDIPHTRTSRAWTSLVLFSVVLIILLIFILQNLDDVKVSFLGLSGTLPLAVAMLFSAVAGALLVAIPGVGRMIQLRRTVRRVAANPPTGPNQVGPNPTGPNQTGPNPAGGMPAGPAPESRRSGVTTKLRHRR